MKARTQENMAIMCGLRIYRGMTKLYTLVIRYLRVLIVAVCFYLLYIIVHVLIFSNIEGSNTLKQLLLTRYKERMFDYLYCEVQYHFT